VAFFALWALSQPQRWEEWINLIIGIWLIIAPFAIGFTTNPGAMWSHIIVGVLVGSDALWAIGAHRPPTHRPA